MRILREMLQRFSLGLVSILFFGTPIFPQDQDPSIELPDEIMKQVVRRVLIWEFKPVKHRKVIRLFDLGIKREWLPKIKNVNFSLLNSDASATEAGSDAFFFRPAEKDGKDYIIGFGYGDPNCGAEGKIWPLRIVKGRARIRFNETGGFGSGCSSDSVL